MKGRKKCLWFGYAKAMLRNYPDKLTEAERRAVEAAIESTKHMKNGKARMEIMDLVYFQRSHNLMGAAQKLGYGYDRAKQIHTQFLHEVGKNFRCEKLE